MKSHDPAPIVLTRRVLCFLQLHIAISKTSARVLIDCKTVAEKAINAAGNITMDGVEVLGRMVRSRGNKDNSAPVRSARTQERGETEREEAELDGPVRKQKH